MVPILLRCWSSHSKKRLFSEFNQQNAENYPGSESVFCVMIFTGQHEHHQAAGTSSVTVVSCLCKPLAMEIPTVTWPLCAGGKRVGPGASFRGVPNPSYHHPEQLFTLAGIFLHQPGCSYVTMQSSLQSLSVDIRNMTALIRPQRFSKALAGGPSYLQQLLIVWWWRKCRGPISTLLPAPGQEWPAQLLLLSISWWQAGLQIPQVLCSCHREVISEGAFLLELNTLFCHFCFGLKPWLPLLTPLLL